MRTQHGAAMAETLLALLPVVLLGSLCIELAHGYQERQLLTLALQEAGRIAAVHQADPQHWQKALDRSLSRLFEPAGRYSSSYVRRDQERAAFQLKFSLPLWQMIHLDSTPETIHLKLTYLHNPWQEWLRKTIRTIYSHSQNIQKAGVQDRGPAADLVRQAWRQGLIPIVLEHRVLRHRSLMSPE